MHVLWKICYVETAEFTDTFKTNYLICWYTLIAAGCLPILVILAILMTVKHKKMKTKIVYLATEVVYL
jgi:hypothetical protein